MIGLWFAIIAVVSYLIGTVNFSRIVSKYGYKKDLSKMGSGNYGTMNVLRNIGFVAGFITLLAEVVKSGLCCLIVRICMAGTGYGEVAFFVAGFFIVIGGMFPVFYNFQGGKGIAAMGGMFLFSRLWWMGLILFFVGVVLILATDLGVISSMVFIFGMSIATTVWAFLQGVPFGWVITVIVWLLTLLSVYKHRGNLNRLFHGKENKSNFRKAFKKMIGRRKEVEKICEDEVENVPEKEIIIEDNEQNESQETLGNDPKN